MPQDLVLFLTSTWLYKPFLLEKLLTLKVTNSYTLSVALNNQGLFSHDSEKFSWAGLHLSEFSGAHSCFCSQLWFGEAVLIRLLSSVMYVKISYLCLIMTYEAFINTALTLYWDSLSICFLDSNKLTWAYLQVSGRGVAVQAKTYNFWMPLLVTTAYTP